MGDDRLEDDCEYVGPPVQSFVDQAHEVTDEERNRPRYGRPSHHSGSVSPALAQAADLPLYPLIEVQRKTGSEPFRSGDVALGFDLLSFWQWAASDLVNNTLRGAVAEYLVARAIGKADDTRIEWNPYDLKTPCGAVIEVKSAAYLQSWSQAKLSSITFSIAPTFAWNPNTNAYETVRRRQADLYVFALLSHRDQATLNPMNVDQWEFHILSTKDLNSVIPLQQSIGLTKLLTLGPVKASFSSLEEAIRQVASQCR